MIMALTKCKECKKEVSTKAKVCPHCGVKDPGVSAGQVVLGFIVLIVIGWVVVQVLSVDEQEAKPAAVAQAAPVPKQTPEQIAAELAACKADLSCWGDKYNAAVGIYCDEDVERLANYSFEWTDGWLEPKFSHFRWMDKEKGWVTYIGDKIKFQNGYGAWQNAIYECDFAPETNMVLGVRAEPGML